MKKWELDKEFSAKVGQFVDSKVYHHLRDCVPPLTNTSNVFQVGEAHSHDSMTGTTLYSTFIFISGHWQYVGVHPQYDKQSKRFTAPETLIIERRGNDMREGEYPDCELRNHRYMLHFTDLIHGSICVSISQWNRPCYQKNGQLKYTTESYMHITGQYDKVEDGWVTTYGMEFLPGKLGSIVLPDRIGFKPRYTLADLLRVANSQSISNYTNVQII